MSEIGRIFTENFLAHYASQYYDPAKAREYYLRTRELKGRERNTSELKTETKKQTWEVAKSEIGKAKEFELAAKAKQNQNLAVMLQTSAEKKRENISNKLKLLMAQLSKSSTTERDRIVKDRQEKLADIVAETASKIEKLPAIPKGLSRERTAELQAERREQIAKIRGDAKSERAGVVNASAGELQKLSEGVSLFRTNIQGTSTIERAQVANQLKGSLDKARENYKVAKQQIEAKYEKAYQTEFDSIKKNAK